MTRVTAVGTAADLGEPPFEEAVSLGTASAIVIVPTTRTIIGDDATQLIGETLT